VICQNFNTKNCWYSKKNIYFCKDKKIQLMKKIFLLLLLAISLSSCEDVKDILRISDADNVAGLKQALTIGATNASQILGAENGYLLSDVRINLPEGAETALNALKSVQTLSNTIGNIPGLGAMLATYIPTISADFDDVLLKTINRAAENAAGQDETVNIFKSAITNMTISDATDILFSQGNNFAATQYLESRTFPGLQALFRPIIDVSLETVTISFGSENYTANNAWGVFATQNNRLHNFIQDNQTALNLASLLFPNEVATLRSVRAVSTTLGGHVTERALEGLFTRVGGEEQKIRTNVDARVSPLLERVFGQLDNR